MSDATDNVSPESPIPWFARAKELQEKEGLSYLQASNRAILEYRLANWPETFGQNLKFLLFGDFDPPEMPISIASLGITIEKTPKDNKAYGWGPGDTLLEATATLSALTVDGVLDAISRINALLGALTLLSWGNLSFDWWAWTIHGGGGGIVQKLDDKHVHELVEALHGHPAPVRRKIESALYWIREPQISHYQRFSRNELRVYSAYWNAFECLVDAINILRPPTKPTSAEKQAQIDAHIRALQQPISSSDIEHLHRSVVNPGLVHQASHALSVVFNDSATKIDACFKRKPRRDRLYDVRNAINHGDIDAENPGELSRVEERRSELWQIVWGMFTALLPPAANAWR